MRYLTALFVSSAAFVAATAIPKAEPLEVSVATNIPSSTTLYARQCTSATAVAVTFDELVNTTFGQGVVITGSISQLGSWNPANGVQLSAAQYTASNPLWSANATLPAGLAFSYKYVRINTDGSYDWEADPDRVYTVPSGCATTATESDTWHSVSSTTSTSAVSSTSTVSTSVSTSAVTPTSTSPSTRSATSTSTISTTSTTVKSTSSSSVTSTSTSLSTRSATSSSTISTTSTTAKSTSSSSPTATSSTSVKTTSSTLTSGTTSSIKTSSSTSSSKVTTPSTSTTSSKTTSSSKISTSSKLSTTSSTKTTSLSSASLTSGTTSATSTCTNSPNSRRCWNSGLSIDTDFDKNWPNTGVTRNYHLTLTNITLAPDGTPRQVFAINGQYPGPTIYADWGDMISVTVTNQLQDNGTTIHWHGLRQYNSNTQDGVPGTTECPLAPGQSKTYTFQATQYGTSWYHSHFSCQYGDGVLGPIVINGPATANYDVDLGPLPITDWYYGSVNMHAARTEHVNAGPPEADNGLINGTMVGNSGGSYARTTLTPGQRHRVRIINTAVDNHFMVGLDGHQMQVITADFVPIVPYNASWIFLGIGQRYDVIITADQTPGSYWFRAEVQDQAGCGTNFGNGNIKSIFSYTNHTTETPTTSKTSYTQRCTDETGLVPYWDSYVPQGTIVTPTALQSSINQSTAADGTLTLYWNVNGSSLDVDWSNPTLKSVRSGSTAFARNANVITLPTEGQWTYWVIEETAGSPFTVNVPHPIHLHGHDFFILGTGASAWQASDTQTLDYDNPARRDVAMLPSGGWLALAFQTDNPGAWLMHCHIAWHADEGFAVQFLESASSIQSVDPYPSDFDSQCAAWNSYYPAKAAYLKHDSGI